MRNKGILAAVLGIFGHQAARESTADQGLTQPPETERKSIPKQHASVRKGHKSFEINGVMIYALNEANAIRKYDKLTKTKQS